MNFKMLFFLSLLSLGIHARTRCDLDALLKSKTGMPPSPSERCPRLSTFWWNDGETPLHVAALENDVASARKLLDEGAEIDARDTQGQTPLFHATRYHNKEMVDLLIRHGANPFVRDHEGATALNRLLQSPREQTEDDTSVIRLFLETRGFRPDNTCENRTLALTAVDGSIHVFQKSNGTLATYTPTLYGNDGTGNDRFQTLAEDYLYSGTIEIIMDLEHDHETTLIRGHLTFDDFSPSIGLATVTHLKVNSLECPWEKWKNFLAIIDIPWIDD